MNARDEEHRTEQNNIFFSSIMSLSMSRMPSHGRQLMMVWKPDELVWFGG
jgi:hypothetical protein